MRCLVRYKTHCSVCSAMLTARQVLLSEAASFLCAVYLHNTAVYISIYNNELSWSLTRPRILSLLPENHIYCPASGFMLELPSQTSPNPRTSIPANSADQSLAYVNLPWDQNLSWHCSSSLVRKHCTLLLDAGFCLFKNCPFQAAKYEAGGKSTAELFQFQPDGTN
jgi:hypothetical protein